MVAINEVLGYRYRYYDGFSANYGFTGIAVALLGRNHPVGVFLAALLFGMLQRGGIFVDAFSEHVTKDLVQVLAGHRHSLRRRRGALPRPVRQVRPAEALEGLRVVRVDSRQ